MNKQRTRTIFFTLITLLLAAGLFVHYKRRAPYSRANPHPNATHELTIFIHGTFNPGLGLLNVFDLWGDKVENSRYAKIVGAMRDDAFFDQEQPIDNQTFFDQNKARTIDVIARRYGKEPADIAYPDEKLSSMERQLFNMFIASEGLKLEHDQVKKQKNGR